MNREHPKQPGLRLVGDGGPAANLERLSLEIGELTKAVYQLAKLVTEQDTNARRVRDELSDLRRAVVSTVEIVDSLRDRVRISALVEASPPSERVSLAGADLLYGVPVLAHHLKLSRAQVYHLSANGTLPTFKIGGKVCARVSDLDRWLATMAAGGEGAQ